MTNLTTLIDVQNREDTRRVSIDQVGIKDVAIPIRILQKNGTTQKVAASATLSVGLGAEVKGTHMSRFVEQLAAWSHQKVISIDLRSFLDETLALLKADSAFVDLFFPYFMDKAAPVTGQKAPMSYPCRITGMSDKVRNDHRVSLGLSIPISTLCPCSKEISDYGAHNQRAIIHATVNIDAQTEHPVVWIEDLVEALESCASCPVFPLLKRPDEKWVTERQYDNPKFVEDVIRDATLLLREYNGITGFSLEVEALESIHGHNAWTSHEENYRQDGYRRQ